jgi:hypothetical protein
MISWESSDDGDDAVSLKMLLWSVVIALVVYGIVLYARGDFG